MRLLVLGPLAVADGSKALELGGAKQRTVLAMLIANVGRPVSADVLVEAVYGEAAHQRAKRTVQTYVSNLRGVLGELIERAPGGWVLSVEREAVDSLAFEDAYRSVHPSMASEERSRALREALEMWRGPPYVDVEAHGLLVAEITRLSELRVAATAVRIDADLAGGSHHELIGELEGLLAEHPYQERFRAQHMLALYRAGRQKDALRSFASMRALLVDELGIEPSPKLQELEQRILEQDRSLEFPSPIASPQTNLPRQATSFVGRVQELAELGKLVRGSRLVTVAGAGGSGKTRLALGAAAQAIDDFPDGVWLVELAPLGDPDLLGDTVMRALGIPDQPGRAPAEILGAHIEGKRLLLVLDNCEHLTKEVAVLVSELLTSTGEARFLVTSRTIIGIGGEVVYRLNPMAVPDPETVSQRADTVRFDGVRLFEERGQVARPDFRVTDDNASLIADLCHRLDGLPLALELAAARLSSFTPRQILDHLEQRFRLLTGGSRTALSRHQALAWTIDWSYGLLGDAEQRLLDRLSVFSGGFTLDAVREVCTDPSLDGFQVLELLPSLVDQSLVVVDTQMEEARYRLLETVRQFARDRLDQASEAGRVRERHARFFRDMAVEAGQSMPGQDEARWLQWIDTELDNLRQAMSWAIAAGEAELALETAGALRRYWIFKVRVREGIGWLQRSIDIAGTSVAKHLRAQGLLGLGTLVAMTDRHTGSEEILNESIALYAELEAEGADHVVSKNYAAALNNLVVTLEIQGKQRAHRTELLRRALEIHRRADDLAGVGMVLSNLGEAAADAGDFDEARRLMDEALEVSQVLDSAVNFFDRYYALGFIELAAGAPDKARIAFEACVAHAIDAEIGGRVASARAYVAVCDADLGDASAVERFASHTSEALKYHDARTMTKYRQQLLVLRSSLDAATGDFERAGQVLGASRSMEEIGKSTVTWEMEARRDRVLEEVRANLGDAAAAEAIDSGRQLDDEAVIELITG